MDRSIRVPDLHCEQTSKEKTMLNTVNVIEFSDGEILGLASYPDDAEGNSAANERFKTLLNENTGLLEDDVNAALDDGYFEDGTWKVVIFHSTV